MPMYSYLFENLLFLAGGGQRKHGVYSILYKYLCVEVGFFRFRDCIFFLILIESCFLLFFFSPL